MIINHIIFAIIVMLLLTLTVTAGVFAITDPLKKTPLNFRIKYITIYIHILVSFCLISSLPFHYINMGSKVIIAPKKTLTFNRTLLFYGELDIVIENYNNGNIIDKQNIISEYPFTKLEEMGIIVNSDKSDDYGEKDYYDF